MEIKWASCQSVHILKAAELRCGIHRRGRLYLKGAWYKIRRGFASGTARLLLAAQPCGRELADFSLTEPDFKKAFCMIPRSVWEADLQPGKHGGNSFGRVVRSVNPPRGQKSIQGQTSDTWFHDSHIPDSLLDIFVKAFAQNVLLANQRNSLDAAVLRVELCYDCINDALIVHNPAENDIFVCGTMDKIVQ